MVPETSLESTSTTTEVITTSTSATTTITPPITSTVTVAVTSFPRADVLLAPPAPGTSGDPGAAVAAGAEVVTVASITDGDTLDVRFEDGTMAEVRLIGTNSPESNECFGEESTQVLTVLAPVGGEIGMTGDVSDEDQYGRLLRYLWVGQMSVNEESVRRGVAIARRYPLDTAMAERLERAQAEAKEAQLGLWAPEACGPRAEASLSIITLEFDPPGNDNDNLNKEWMQIRNEGDNLVDLAGWMIRDESASIRFEFPPAFTLAPGESVAVYSGCGDDFGAFLYWCSVGSAIWNNDGDTAFLLDSQRQHP